MRIAVLNYSGNVGKSTLARHLLQPRLDNASIVSVETINSDDYSYGETFSGKEFDRVQEQLWMAGEHVIVDVGSSNLDDFLNEIQRRDGSIAEFDWFVIPTTAEQKVQRDTLTTAQALQSAGVSAEQILVVLNRVARHVDVHHAFASLFEFAGTLFQLDPSLHIHENDFFSQSSTKGLSIAELVADETDLRAAIVAATDLADKRALVRRLGMRQLASGVQKELQAVFEALFGQRSTRKAS